MLYISSRNKMDAFTSNRALCEDRAPDGGLYIPYQIPQVEMAQLNKMREATFCENVADILNLFFSVKLTSWDVECAIGRMPVRLMEMSHRLITAECFHNPENTYTYLERGLYRQLRQRESGTITAWARIAIRISVLFALYAIMPETARDSFDVAVTTGDFSVPMAVWYAREMGLPIRMIICCCNENGATWDLIQRGEFNAGMPLVDTAMPELDHSSPEHIEQLVYHTLGYDRTEAFNAVCQKRGTFRLEEDEFKVLGEGLAAAVVGRNRITDTIRSVHRTNQYFVSPHTAIIYGGLQDYRSRSGESRYTLILADRSPVLHSDQVCQICGVTKMASEKAVTITKE